MGNNALYERDLLYPTDNIFEPGSVHMEIMNPGKKGKMPIVIEGKTLHSPLAYINSIIRIMQSDIFDRIHIDVKNNTELYINIKHNTELKKDFNGKKFIKVIFDGDKIAYTGVDEISD